MGKDHYLSFLSIQLPYVVLILVLMNCWCLNGFLQSILSCPFDATVYMSDSLEELVDMYRR